MRKNKFNPELLKEELKRFKMLENYDFYTGEKSEVEYKDEALLLGTELEEAEGDEAPDDLQPADAEGNGEVDANAADAVAGELGVDAAPVDDAPVGDMPEPEAAPIEEPAIEEPVDDSVEVDVTSLVQGSEDAKAAAEQASQNSEMLLNKLSDLEARIARMDSVSAKIEDLEKEIVKRNPTPVEKLEMRSLSSFPYSQKLTDYWADKEGAYDVMGNDKKEEYVLKQDDVDYDYSEPNIKKSFTVNTDEFEEEDI
jgi:hypothetical protein